MPKFDEIANQLGLTASETNELESLLENLGIELDIDTETGDWVLVGEIKEA